MVKAASPRFRVYFGKRLEALNFFLCLSLLCLWGLSHISLAMSAEEDMCNYNFFEDDINLSSFYLREELMEIKKCSQYFNSNIIDSSSKPASEIMITIWAKHTCCPLGQTYLSLLHLPFSLPRCHLPCPFFFFSPEIQVQIQMHQCPRGEA
jgi:hypothetical protein